MTKYKEGFIHDLTIRLKDNIMDTSNYPDESPKKWCFNGYNEAIDDILKFIKVYNK